MQTSLLSFWIKVESKRSQYPNFKYWAEVYMSANEKGPNGDNNGSGLGKKDKGVGVARSSHSRAGVSGHSTW